MKIIRLLTLLFVLLPLTVANAYPVQQHLHQGWTFKQVRGTNWYPATVPGVVHTDLLNNKLIDDPFYRLNERGVQWVDKEDWMYRTTFDVTPELLAKTNIVLHFEGLDTYADVTLNGQKILSADNMFREWKADVRSLLKQKGNQLQVYLHSPIKIAMPKWESVPFQYRSSNDQSENGGLLDRKVGVFVRKAGYHFGWDWGPRLVTSGIWRPVTLEAWDEAHISDVHYTQTSVNANRATIDVMVEVFADKALTAQVAVANRTDHRTECQQTIQLQKGMNKVLVSFTLKNPRLWWTNGLGEPFLYDFAVTLHLDGKETDTKEQKLGIRSLKVVAAPDKEGESFYFELNGKPLFAKGANYIPCDNFLPRVTDAIYEKTIQDAVSANMNMLRVWGGGTYESDLFYDLCDKYGILVWQDFMFACSMFPAEGDLLENIRQEAIDNVRRLRNHTCIALWCGSNECLDAWFNWNWKSTYDKQNPAYSERIWKQFKEQYFVTLPKVVEEHHPGACYRKSSPYADDKGTRNHAVGDMHYWEVWQGHKPLSQFNKERSRFFSEYGFQSFPEFESIKRYAPFPEDWNLTSEVMMSHQRGGATANKRINDFLLSEYRQPKDFPAFTYMSQLLQADAMKMAMEAHRRDMPYCMGSLVWQHNDCWPVASWSSRDYYGRWKAQHYFTVKSFDDLLLSPMEEKGVLRVFAVSDRLKETSGTLTVRTVKLDGETIGQFSRKVTVPANTSTVVWESEVSDLIRQAAKESVVIHVAYRDKTGRTYTNNYFLAKHKEMRYPKAHIAKEIVPVNGGYEVTLTSDVFARGVFLSLKGDTDNFISDNYMDLLPGESVKVKITTSLLPASFADRLQIASFSDMYVTDAAAVDTYPLAPCYSRGKQHTLRVGATDVPVQAFTPIYDFTHFSFSGKQTLTITVKEDIRKFTITPLSLGIKGVVKGNQLTFDLKDSRYLIVKINDLKELAIAADEQEADVPASSGKGIYNISAVPYKADKSGKTLSTAAIQSAIDDANRQGGGTVYIPAGLYYCSNLVLRSKVHIYMEGGAVIRGTGNPKDYATHYRKESLKMDGTWFIYTEDNCADIKLYGRGTIDGNGSYMRNKHQYLNNLLVPMQCSGFTIDGISFIDSGLWGVIPTRCDHVTILNTKHYNENDKDHEDDGIDIQECQHVLVKHTIAIAEDDTYSTKTWTQETDIAGKWYGQPEVLDNVVFDDCLGWSRCATFKLGFGVNQDQTNLRFINSTSYKSMRAIAINHRWGKGIVRNIVFDNIDVEGFWPRDKTKSRWLEITMGAPETVENIIIRNVRVRDVGNAPSVIKGYDAAHPLKNVTLENIYMYNHSSPAYSLQEMNVTEVNKYIHQLHLLQTSSN